MDGNFIKILDQYKTDLESVYNTWFINNVERLNANRDEIFYLVVPDKREKNVCMQLCRPAIKGLKTKIKYILFSYLRKDCDALCKFGENHLVMEKIAKEV